MKEDVTEKSDQIRHGFIEDPTKGPRVEIMNPALHLQDRQREGSCSCCGHSTTALTWHQTRPGGPQDSGGSADTPTVFLSHDVGLHVPLAPLKLASPPASPPAVLCPRLPATPLPRAMAMFTELSPSWFHPSSYSALLPEKFSKKLPSASSLLPAGQVSLSLLIIAFLSAHPNVSLEPPSSARGVRPTWLLHGLHGLSAHPSRSNLGPTHKTLRLLFLWYLILWHAPSC